MKRCPKCGSHGMPAIQAGSQATARACQNCGWVQELISSDETFTFPKLTPEVKQHG
jgi:uncharacterized Zn finger protein